MAMPPAEPPAADVVVLLEQLQRFRQHLDDAGRQLHMITQSLREAEHTQRMPAGSLTYYRIEARIARNRLMLWTREVRALERRARMLGLQP